MDNSKNSIFITAEIGINHNGDIKIAKKLIDMAKNVGCDAVKFQKRTIKLVYSSEELKKYRESPWGTTVLDQKRGLEFGREEYDEINKYCSKKNIDWFASAWDIPSQKFLKKYNLKSNKIASAMMTHWDFVEYVAREKKLTFISTGMSTYKDIDRIVKIFDDNKCPYILMHSVSVYPCIDSECNIFMVRRLKERYKCRVGYSGHEVGLLPSILAVAMGAEAIERHITLDRIMYGTDQAASLEARGLEILVRDCRRIKEIIGNGHKTISEKEKITADKLRYFQRYR